jgi:peptidoglycan/LPS O-acetylase OafA/YrhL
MSFTDLGGDSLRYLGVALDLERALGHLPDGWGEMKIRELEASTATAGPTWMETATVLRALSIFFVISGHLQFMSYGGGGAMLLLSIAGFSFAMYTMPAVLAQGSVRPILAQVLRVAIPATLYLSFLSLFFFPFDLRVVLLFSNWIDPHLHGNAAAWFVDVYVQIFLVMALLFLLPPVRRLAAERPWPAAVGFLLVSIVTFRIAHEFWDTHHLYRRLPHMLMWLFALGIAARLADTTGRKLIVSGLALLALLLFTDNAERVGANLLRWYTPGFLLLVWLPRIEVPSWSAGAIRRVAGASLFIYLTHFQWAAVSRRVVEGVPAMPVIFALVGGVAMWIAYEALYKRVMQAVARLQARRNRTAPRPLAAGE